MEIPRMLEFSDRAGSTLCSHSCSGSCCPPHDVTASAPGIWCFRGPIALPACAPVNASPVPLRGLRMTRGRRVLLALRRRALSSASSCRFIPAHYVPAGSCNRPSNANRDDRCPQCRAPWRHTVTRPKIVSNRRTRTRTRPRRRRIRSASFANILSSFA